MAETMVLSFRLVHSTRGQSAVEQWLQRLRQMAFFALSVSLTKSVRFRFCKEQKVSTSYSYKLIKKQLKTIIDG